MPERSGNLLMEPNHALLVNRAVGRQRHAFDRLTRSHFQATQLAAITRTDKQYGFAANDLRGQYGRCGVRTLRIKGQIIVNDVADALTSKPRAATSVATTTLILPFFSWSIMRSRCF